VLVGVAGASVGAAVLVGAAEGADAADVALGVGLAAPPQAARVAARRSAAADQLDLNPPAPCLLTTGVPSSATHDNRRDQPRRALCRSPTDDAIVLRAPERA
jgi:hypothetical protein